LEETAEAIRRHALKRDPVHLARPLSNSFSFDV